MAKKRRPKEKGRGRLIILPEAFRLFVSGFHQDIECFYGSFDAAVEAMIRERSKLKRLELKAFLEFLLNGGFSDQTLKKAWDANGPDWNFYLGGHRRFFRQVIAEIDKSMLEKGPISDFDRRWGHDKRQCS